MYMVSIEGRVCTLATGSVTGLKNMHVTDLIGANYVGLKHGDLHGFCPVLFGE